MPTIIMLDVSLSMFRPIQTVDNTEHQTRLTLAASAVFTILDYLSVHCKLEYVSLVSFSSNHEILVPFTRDYDAIKSKIPYLEEGDKTCFEQAFHGVNQLVITEWGSQTLMQIILITDGSCGSGPLMRNQVMSRLPLPPLYPARIHVLPICGPNDPSLVHALPLYQKIVDSVTNVSTSNMIMTRGAIYCPEQLTLNGISSISTKLCEQNYQECWCILRCGGLESRVCLFPPHQHHVDAAAPIGKVIHVIGFILTQDLGTPITVSRHLIIPQAQVGTANTHTYETKKEGSGDVTVLEDDMSDPSTIPNFCVLLHGALKVGEMSAIVSLAPGWWGAISAGCEANGGRARKSALILSALHPRLAPAPWLGPLEQLGPQMDQTETFPIKANRSYSSGSGGAAWARPHALLADVQKVLRHARKLPDKTQNLFKELNRLRRAAISLGFTELLTCVCQALERECASLAAGTPPEVSLQLAHAAAALRDPRAAMDVTHTLQPLANTSFGTSTHSS